MPKNHRRSISVTAETYARVTALVATTDARSISGVVEGLLDARCDAAGIPKVARDVARAARQPRKPKTKPDPDQHGGGCFTF